MKQWFAIMANRCHRNKTVWNAAVQNAVVLIAGVVLMLLAVASQATPVCVDSDMTLEVSGNASEYSLQLQAGVRYVGWLEERGVDIAVSTDAGQTWVDSAPWRWGHEPVLLQADSTGRAAIRLRGLKTGKSAQLRVWLQCASAMRLPTRRFWRDARRVAQLRTALDDDWQLLRAGKAMLFGFRALYSYAQTDAERAWMAFQLAALARQRGLLGQAAAWYGVAADASEQAGVATWHASALFRQAQALYAKGESNLAVLYQRVEALSRQAGQIYQAESARQDYCLILRARGDVDTAVQCLREQVAAFHRLGEAVDECVALRNLSMAMLLQGHYMLARATLEQAAAVAYRLNDPREIAGVLKIQAHLNAWAGRFEQALQQLQSVKTLTGQSGSPLQVARVDALIANVYLLAGQAVLARSYLQHAIAAFDQYGARVWQGEAHLATAKSFSMQGQWQQALSQIGLGLHALQAGNASFLRIAAQIERARLQLNAGRLEAAQHSLASLRNHANEWSWSDQSNLTVLEFRLHMEQASQGDEQALMQLMDAALQRGRILDYLTIAEALAFVPTTAGMSTALVKRLEQAMRLGRHVARRVGSPYLRNSILRRLLPLANRELFALQDGDLLTTAQVQRLLVPIMQLRQIDRASSATPHDDDALMELERVLSDELLNRGSEGISKARRNGLLAAIGNDPGVIEVTPLTFDLTGLAVPNNVVYIFVTDVRRIGLLLWTGRQWQWHRVTDRNRLNQQMHGLSSQLQAGHVAEQRLQSMAKDLARSLFVEQWQPSVPEHVYVLADAGLQGLPWAVLPVGEQAESLGLLAPIIGLQGLQPQAEPKITRLNLLGFSPGPDSALDSLPQLQQELDAVAAIWTPKHRQRRFNAGRDDLIVALHDPGALVHLAAHGRGDRGQPEESGLWLTATDPVDSQFVSAMRLRHVAASAAVVYLSACESGQSAAMMSLGAGGVAGSLVDAGVSTVVGSRWMVSDRSAREFAEAFHRALVAPGTTPAEAVLAARRSLHARPATQHPAQWAGWFVLQAGPSIKPGHSIEQSTQAR